MRRHDLDVFSLVAGLVFLAIAVGHVVDETSSVSLDGRWVAPLALLALGAAGLASALRRSQPVAAGAPVTGGEQSMETADPGDVVDRD